MNIYLVISETIYHTNEILKKLTNGCDNIISYNLEENTLDDVLTEASYFSMFDSDKCIIVRNAKFFLTKDSESKDKDKLLKYMEDENPRTKLIFLASAKVDTRKKIYTNIKENNHVYEVKSLTKTAMKNELQGIAKSYKYNINDKCLWYIINNSLGNFDLAYNELKKIMLYYSNPGEIKYEDVINLSAKTLEENNFKLVDSIIDRDISTSLKLLEEFKIFKGEVTAIVALLYREFKLMYLTHLYLEESVPQNKILTELKLPDWMYEKVRNNLRKYRLDEIKKEIVNLSKLDYQLKSGNINKDLALISYIINICL